MVGAIAMVLVRVNYRADKQPLSPGILMMSCAPIDPRKLTQQTDAGVTSYPCNWHSLLRFPPHISLMKLTWKFLFLFSEIKLIMISNNRCFNVIASDLTLTGIYVSTKTFWSFSCLYFLYVIPISFQPWDIDFRKCNMQLLSYRQMSPVLSLSKFTFTLILHLPQDAIPSYSLILLFMFAYFLIGHVS